MENIKLGELGIFARGVSKHRPRNAPELYEGGGYPLVQTGDITNANFYINSHSQEYNRIGLQQSKLWPKGTLAITIAANIAETGILSYPMAFPDSVVGFNSYDGKTTNQFMHYLLSNFRKNIQSNVRSTGSIQDNINLKFLNELKLEVPDFQSQNDIVKVLSNIDKKIELNNKVNDELSQIADYIYSYWFIGFNFPNEKGLPYFANNGALTYSSILNKNIPSGWKTKKLGDLFISKNDNTKKIKSSNIFSNGTYPVITQDVGKMIKGYTNMENPIIDLPVLVFGDHSCTIRYVDFPFFRGADGTQLLYFENKELLLLAYFWINKIISLLPNYGKYERHFKYLKDCYVIIPNNEILINFSTTITPFLEKIQQNNKESSELELLRDWLLPMLMNGQIKTNN